MPGLEWTKLYPILSEIESMGLIRVSELHTKINERFQQDGHKIVTENTVYKWVKGSTTPTARKDYPGTYNIVQAIAEVVLDIVLDKLPSDQYKFVEKAVYEQEAIHLKALDGQNIPIPSQCLIPSYRMKQFLGNYMLFRVGVAEDDKSLELKQVPFRLFERGKTVVYEEFFLFNDVDVGGSGFAYHLANSLTIFLFNELKIAGQKFPSLLCGSFNMDKRPREWIGSNGYAGVFVAADDRDAYPVAHKAVIVKDSLAEWACQSRSWEEFKTNNQANIPLCRSPNGKKFVLNEKDLFNSNNQYLQDLRCYIDFLSINDGEMENFVLSTSYAA